MPAMNKTDVAQIWRDVYGGTSCDLSAFEFAAAIEKHAVAAERDTLDRTILELIDLWGTHGNAALIAGDAATSNAWAAAVATVRDVSAAIRAERA